MYVSRLMDQWEFRCGGLSKEGILQLHGKTTVASCLLNCYSKSHAVPQVRTAEGVGEINEQNRWVILR